MSTTARPHISSSLSHEEIHNLRSLRSVTSRHGAGTVPEVNALAAADEIELLAEIGYKQELKRTMSGFGCFGIAFSIMGLLPSIITLMATGLSGLGPVSLLWGWFVSGLFILVGIAIPMAETSSSLPTSGGLYYWTNYYAPQKWKTLLSFFIGITNSFALAGGTCSIIYGLAVQILSAVYIGKDGQFDITDGKTYGVFVACIFAAALVATLSSKNTSRLQLVSIIANNILIIIFFIALPIGTAKNSKFNDASFIFGKVENFSEWSSGWAFFLYGMMPASWTIGAFDSCVHMSEEVSNPVRNVPIGIVGSVSACWIIGFCIMIVINACLPTDISSIIDTPSGQPLAQLFYDNLGKRWAIAFISLSAFCQFLMGCSIVTAVSRQAWAFARDDGLPFSSFFKVVNKRLAVPVRAIWFSSALAAVIGLLILVGPQATNALFSITIIGNYVSWGVPQLLRITSGRDIFRPGMFFIGKKLSYGVIVTGLLFQVFIIVIACMPDTKTVDKTTMNYAVVLNGSVWILSIFYFYIYKRKTYNGPKSNLTDEEYIEAVSFQGDDQIHLDSFLVSEKIQNKSG
ncbi:hypothetical protein WICMUC_005665 [Wickerhamomyces mucosus]|uniref:GABA-specific permease n=1 Tax=Wickerhamomyces mucosus TaxID=1378264 RepID=A0A9P8P6V3_9ASCO|nr:hypothetical protein WICMUC_005665 [Wickerhamomyces mucosus]